MASRRTADAGGGRLAWLSILVAVAAAVLLLPAVHGWLLQVIDSAAELIRQRPAAGMVAFVLLAGLSAMLAFVSSAMLIPVAVHIWGPAVSAVLLWLGWFAGGLAAYAVGRYLGRPIVERLVRREKIERYERWARSGLHLLPILLIQLAIPSDVVGYLFGLVRCRLRVFVAALAIAEVPYAVGAVYLGVSFLQRNALPLIGLGLAGITLSAWALWWLHRREAPTGGAISHPRT